MNIFQKSPPYTTREVLECCKRWFEKWSPCTKGLNGELYQHPMLEMLESVLAKPQTMLMLEILHECPDTQEAGYEYTEAWPYADTETGLKSATAAIYADIERCKEDEDEENGGCAAPFQHARIYRCTLNEHGAYADGDLIVEVLATDDSGFLTVSKAEHSEVDGSKPEIALEVGKKYWTRDKHIAQVDYHNTSNGIFSGYIRGGLQNVSWLPSGRYWGSYTDYPLDLIAEYKEQTP